MSEPAAEATEGEEAPESIELPTHGDAAFGALMDALAPEEGDEGDGEGEPSAEAAAGGDGSATPEDQGADADKKPAAKQAAGDGGKQDPPADGDDGDVEGDTSAAKSGGGDLPAEWTATAADLTPKFGELSTKLEDTVARAHHETALDEVRTEHERYFQELEKHPRLLVGTEVPRIGGEGMETLRDAADAKEWQEAVKSVLVEEVRDRASRAIEESSDFLTTVHQSIELFQNNADLIPGTKEFDVELANKFASMMKSYELRDDDEKLMGYSVPVQPIINQLRSDLVSGREAAKKATPAASSSSNDKKKKSAQQATPEEDGPQAGISSKAGESSDNEDYSTLFGTLGLPNMRI